MHKKRCRRRLAVCSMVFLVFACNVLGEEPDTSKVQVKRTWRDSSELFVMDARLLELSPSTVKLRSVDDGRVVELSRSRLSKVDQEYLLTIDKAKNPFAAQSQVASSLDGLQKGVLGSKSSAVPFALSTLNQNPLPTLQNVVLYSQSKKPESIRTEPMTLPAIGDGEAYVGESFGSRVSPLVLLDKKSKTVAISSCPASQDDGRPGKGRIYIGQLPNGPFKAAIETEDRVTILDHNLETGQTLVATSQVGDQGDRDIVVIEGLHEGLPFEKSRFRLPAERGQRRDVSQARLVGLNQVVVAFDGIVYGWDLNKGMQVFQSDPLRHQYQKISFSHDRKLMVLGTSHGFHLASTLTGEDLGFVAVQQQYGTEVSFDSSGNRFAFCFLDAWGIYDYETKTMRAPETTTWKLDGKLIGWLSPDLLLAGEAVVLHTKLGVPVWKYHTYLLNGGFIWKDGITTVDRQNGLRLRTLPVPHDPLKGALQELDKVENLLATGPGTKVQLKFQLPDPLPKEVNFEELKRKMVQIIAKASWELDESAPLSLVVQIAEGKPYKTQYLYMKPGEPFPRQPAQPEQIEVTPMLSRLELRAGDVRIWHMESSINGGPNFFGPTQKSKEDFVTELSMARPGFFYDVMLPIRIPRQPYTYGLGESSITSGGWAAIR